MNFQPPVNIRKIANLVEQDKYSNFVQIRKMMETMGEYKSCHGAVHSTLFLLRKTSETVASRILQDDLSTHSLTHGLFYAELSCNNFESVRNYVDCTRTGSLLQWFPAFANDSIDKFQPPRGWGKTFIGQEGVFILIVCSTGDFHYYHECSTERLGFFINFQDNYYWRFLLCIFNKYKF